MAATTFGWLVLLCPLVGTVANRRDRLPGRDRPPFYALRMFIVSMHNRVGRQVATREIGLADLVPLAPIVLVILVFAFYPQFGLRRSEPTLKAAISSVQLASSDPR